MAIRTSARYVATAVAAAGLAMLFEPFFSAFLSHVGINTADWVPPFIRFFGSISDQAWFQFATVLITGIAIGSWLDWLLRRLERAKPSKTDRLRELSTQLFYARQTFGALLEDIRRQRSLPGEDAAKLNSIYVSLRKIGIPTPEVSSTDVERDIRLNHRFLTAIYPLASDGHFEEAKKLAADIVAEAQPPEPSKPQFRYGQSG